jgi:hypothetical protein
MRNSIATAAIVAVSSILCATADAGNDFEVDKHYAEISDRQGADRGLLSLYFKTAVPVGGVNYDRVVIFFSTDEGDRIGYNDSTNKRVVVFRHIRDFSSILAMVHNPEKQPLYGTWLNYVNGDVAQLFLQVDDTNSVSRRRAQVEPDPR